MEYFDVEPEHTSMPDDKRNPNELKGDIEVSDLSFPHMYFAYRKTEFNLS